MEERSRRRPNRSRVVTASRPDGPMVRTTEMSYPDGSRVVVRETTDTGTRGVKTVETSNYPPPPPSSCPLPPPPPIAGADGAPSHPSHLPRPTTTMPAEAYAQRPPPVLSGTPGVSMPAPPPGDRGFRVSHGAVLGSVQRAAKTAGKEDAARKKFTASSGPSVVSMPAPPSGERYSGVSPGAAKGSFEQDSAVKRGFQVSPGVVKGSIQQASKTTGEKTAARKKARAFSGPAEASVTTPLPGERYSVVSPGAAKGFSERDPAKKKARAHGATKQAADRAVATTAVSAYASGVPAMPKVGYDDVCEPDLAPEAETIVYGAAKRSGGKGAANSMGSDGARSHGVVQDSRPIRPSRSWEHDHGAGREGRGPGPPYAGGDRGRGGEAPDLESSLAATGRGGDGEEPPLAPLEAAVARDARDEARHRILDEAREAPLIDASRVVPVDLPVDPSKDDEEAERPAGGRNCATRRNAIVLSLLAVAAVGLAVGTSLGISRNDDSGPPIPTPKPTTEQFAAYKKVVANVSGEEALSDPASPQYRALDWLANDDAYKEAGPYQDVVQRYALAAFFFASGGDTSWEDEYNFLKPTHECLWNGEGILHASFKETKGVFCDNNYQVNHLSLSENNLTGSLAPELGELAHMNYLILLDNSLSGPIPTTLYQLENLWVLWLAFNDFSGTIASSIGNMNELVLLWLGTNHLTGGIPDSLGSLPLTALNLENNQMTGKVPDSIGALRLEQVNLANNSFIGHLPDFSSPDMKVMLLNDNDFSGTLPRSFSDLTGLGSLTLNNNNITGGLPDFVMNLRQLTVLNVQNNQMNGTIPQSIGNLDRLWGMALAENSFSGTIPASMESLTGVEMMLLGPNRLGGTLPTFFGTFTNLSALHLHENKFYGTVPDSFKNLTKLDSLLVNGNDLTGDLGFLCGIGISLLSADCGGNKPEISCHCCTLCCQDGLGCQ